MGLNKTDFIDGLSLSFPLESLPKLFGVLGTVSRKAFFEKLAELDSAGGAGISIDQIVQIIHVGLMAEYPQLNLEDAKRLTSKFYEENGQDALENLIVDSFADARLSDKNLVEKRRDLLKEIVQLDLKRMECIINSKTAELEEAEAKVAERVASLGNQSKTPNLKKKRI